MCPGVGLLGCMSAYLILIDFLPLFEPQFIHWEKCLTDFTRLFAIQKECEVVEVIICHR